MTLIVLQPIEPLRGNPSDGAGSLGQDMAGRDTGFFPGSAGLSTACLLSH
jgi:hypothetical protein